MAIVNRPPINSNNDHEHYDVLVNRQTKMIRTSFSLGSTVVAHQKDGGPWIPGTVVGRGDHNHSYRSYMI